MHAVRNDQHCQPTSSGDSHERRNDSESGALRSSALAPASVIGLRRRACGRRPPRSGESVTRQLRRSQSHHRRRQRRRSTGASCRRRARCAQPTGRHPRSERRSPAPSAARRRRLPTRCTRCTAPHWPRLYSARARRAEAAARTVAGRVALRPPARRQLLSGRHAPRPRTLNRSRRAPRHSVARRRPPRSPRDAPREEVPGIGSIAGGLRQQPGDRHLQHAHAVGAGGRIQCLRSSLTSSVFAEPRAIGAHGMKASPSRAHTASTSSEARSATL